MPGLGSQPPGDRWMTDQPRALAIGSALSTGGENGGDHVAGGLLSVSVAIVVAMAESKITGADHVAIPSAGRFVAEVVDIHDHNARAVEDGGNGGVGSVYVGLLGAAGCVPPWSSILIHPIVARQATT